MMTEERDKKTNKGDKEGTAESEDRKVQRRTEARGQHAKWPEARREQDTEDQGGQRI